MSLVERLSFYGMDEAVNDELMRAIGGKHLVEFVYKAGRTRIVEPHDYGIRRDVERLLGFQIGGESQSGASHGWKEFRRRSDPPLTRPGPSVRWYTGR